MAVASGVHRAGRAEGAGRRVIQLGRGQLFRAVISCGYEDATVGEQGGGVNSASGFHRAGRAEGAARRVIQLG